jgi:hypothetical protein
MSLVKHKNSKNVCGLWYHVYRSVDPRYIEQTPTCIISIVWDLGCAGFAKKIFCFKAKRDLYRMCFARSREIIFFSASFRFEFFASDQSEINRSYFELFLLSFASNNFLFRFFLFCFCFISSSFRFRCKKQAKKHFFRIEAKKFCFRFASKQN